MTRKSMTFAFGLPLSLMLAPPTTVPAAAQQAAPASVVLPTDRTVLPIPEPQYPHITVLDARNAKPPPRFEVKAPANAPNVLIVLIDDMGFGLSSAFGGPIHMPTVEHLANEGLRYNQFHTTALCSPTRTALLTGRNHHMNNMGSITETATAFPGQTGQRPNSVAPLAEMLRLNGYSTAAFGKSHETAAWEVSPSGPTDRWPTRSGFDKFYGFIGGETNQWAPLLYDGMNQVEPPHDPNYHFMTDMTNQAIDWMQFQKSLTPDKPFFIYFAPGATHAPHHVPKEWIAKYKGKFDQGWDKLREETLARQIKLGVVPAGTKLAPKPEAIKDWAALSADEKKLFARQMEVFAGFGEYADTEIGRLIEAIKATGQLDNTLIFYIVGDNGASAEGGMNGLFNEMTYFNGVHETVQDILKHYDELGGPTTYPPLRRRLGGRGRYAVHMDETGCLQLRRHPQRHGDPLAQGHRGEGRATLAVAPCHRHRADDPRSGRPARAEERQWHAPDADRRREHGLHVCRRQGSEHAQDAVLRDLRQPRHLQRRLAGRHRPPGRVGTQAPHDARGRHLGALRHAVGLQPGERPGREESREAKGTAGPLPEGSGQIPRAAYRRPHPRAHERGLGRTARPDGRPHVADGSRGHDGDVGERLHQRQEPVAHDHRRRGDPEGGANGVILAQAGRFGGWSLYLKDGKPTYTYNFLGLQRYTVAAKQALPAGKATIRFEFAYDGGGVGKGGTGTLFVNGKNVATGRIDRTQAAPSRPTKAPTSARTRARRSPSLQGTVQVHRQDRPGDDRIEGNEEGRPR